MVRFHLLALPLIASVLAACGSAPLTPSKDHLQASEKPVSTASIPQPVIDAPTLAAPKAAPRPETYSVVVNEVPVQQLLFALARDAKFNVDIHPGLEGTVSLNALNQTLPQILERVSAQVNMRYEIRDKLIVAGPDTSYLREYLIDYVNMERKTKANVTMSTSISSAGGGIGGATSGVANASSSEVENTSNNQLWITIEQNIKDLIQEEDKIIVNKIEKANNSKQKVNNKAETDVGGNTEKVASQEPDTQSPQQTSETREANHVIVNRETGVIAVRATGRQHKKIEEFLAKVQAGASRQVLIEATLVEVTLDDSYQGGVDWSRIGTSLNNSLNISQALTGSSFGTGPVTTLTFASNSDFFKGTFSATMKLLETFGKTRVLSSPKVMALNNQTALLKVVDEKVYFEMSVNRTPATTTTPATVDYSSTIKSVPIGVMMSVTPQISRDKQISLNVRPTITRITGYKVDPVASLLGSKVDNLIPEIQVREIESTLKLSSGQTAILGGLMQESVDKNKSGIPVLMNLPWVGDLFTYRDDGTKKTELIIFLQPTVVDNPSLDGDLSKFKDQLPGNDFFNAPGLKPAGSF